MRRVGQQLESHRVLLTAAIMLAGIAVGGSGCGSDESDEPPAEGVTFSDAERERIYDLAAPDGPPTDATNAVADDPAAARLGQFLFFDTRLSSNGEVACASCHAPDKGFGDGLAVSEGVGTTGRHAPTALNAAYNRWQFWDGRADSLWSQALKPLEAPAEHGTNRLAVAHLVYRDAELKAAYEAVFGAMPDLADTERFPENARPVGDDPDHPHHQAWQAMAEADLQAVNRVFSNVGKAVAAYEMKLVSLEAPFDRFADALAAGDPSGGDAMTDSQKRGLKLFIGRANCVECHDGAMLTDREFHNLGLAPRAWLDPMDEGRYAGITALKADPFNAAGAFSDAPDGTRADEVRFLAQNDSSRGQFKTPTLRNVALTAPYMHGGHFETLEEVVRFYDELDESPVQVDQRDEVLVPLELDDAEVADLVAFLEALTGQPLDPSLTVQPDSPR